MAMRRRSELAKEYDFTSWREFPPMNISMGTMLHNRTGSWRFIKPIYEDKIPACQNACPAGNDIEGWIKLLQKGEYEKAYWHLKQEQPFPAILGRVCFKFCEAACNRTALDDCVGINELERFIGDQVALYTPHPDLPEYHGKSLAIVGSGPAGMSAAYYGRLLGFKVTIFEALPKLGGILCVGIPTYRLPQDIVTEEFHGLKEMGIELRPGTPIGKTLSIHDLRKDYNYILLATGVHASMKLEIEGEEESPRVMSGLAMLKRVALGDDIDLGKRAAVIGGGNTAIDSARTAIRLGCDVTIIYRRSEAEMPAHPEEVQEALEEGVQLRTLATPERIELDDNRHIRRLVCCEMELGEPDETGRRRPLKKEGALFDVETDTILTAIGEAPILDYLKGLVDTEKQIISVSQGLKVELADNGLSQVFAGGDIIDQPHTVVHAVASGKKAAIAMDCDRKGLDLADMLKEITIGEGSAISFSKYMGWEPVNPIRQNNAEVVDSSKIVYDYFEKASQVKRDIQSPDIRKGSFEFYTRAFSKEEAQQEAARCMHCGRCTECNNCLIFCPDVSVLVKGNGHFGYDFDYDYCKGCGICFTECPRNAITMIQESTATETDN
jgi:2-oxoacid:acceptor oxidoreductase delta subunit (pyruvate/2-ketoisovalerate family)